MSYRYSILLVVFFAAALLFAVPVYAAIEVMGKITSVEKEKVTMTDGSSEQTLVVNKETKITIKGKASKLEDLKVDQEVKATVEQDGDKLIAKTIVAE